MQASCWAFEASRYRSRMATIEVDTGDRAEPQSAQTAGGATRNVLDSAIKKNMQVTENIDRMQPNGGDVIPELQRASRMSKSQRPVSRPTTSRTNNKHVQVAALRADYQDIQPQGPISDAGILSTSGSVEPSPEERVRALMNAYSPRRVVSARSSNCTPRSLDTSRRHDANAVSAHEGLLNDERKLVVSSYIQTVTRLASVFNEERKKSEAKAKEKLVLIETLRDLNSSCVVPAAMQGSHEQATIAELTERVEALTREFEDAGKEARMCEHMVERTRLSARKKELKIKHLKVLHDRVAMDRDQAELTMLKAQDERLTAENRVFQLESDLEEQRARNPQALAGLRRVCEKRQEMLLQRSLWENRVQADIDAIQRAERERSLRAKLVINSLHVARARQTHQDVKEKAEDFEERLKHVEQTTGVRIDLRNVGDVVDLVIRQRKLKDLQADKVRGEARREALADEVRELHAALWSLMNVPERSSKMLDELSGPLRRAETRAEKATREVQTNTMLALKLKSWLRNLTEKLATVDMLVGNDRRGTQDVPPAPVGPSVTLAMPDEDLIKAIELLENRLYRCLLVASAPVDGAGTPARDPKTPRAGRQSIFPTPLTSPRTANPSSSQGTLKSPMMSPLSSFARLIDSTNSGKLFEHPIATAQSEEAIQTATPSFDIKATLRSPGAVLASIVESASPSARESLSDSGTEAPRSARASSGPGPSTAARNPEPSTKIASSTGKLRASLRPKLAAITSLLRPRTATISGSSSAMSRSADPPRSRPPAAAKLSKSWNPQASVPGDMGSEGPDTLSAPSVPNARVPKLAIKQKSDTLKPRVTLDVNPPGGLEAPGRTPREFDAVGSTSFRRRPASAHPLVQAASNQLQTLKPEQLDALVLGQSTPRDVALDLLSRPGGNNWRLDQKTRNLRECFMTGPNAEDANGVPTAVPRSRSARRSTLVTKILDDDKEDVLEREDIKQQSAKILDLLRVAEKKWEDDERKRVESEREAALLTEKDQAEQRIQRLARRK